MMRLLSRLTALSSLLLLVACGGAPTGAQWDLRLHDAWIGSPTAAQGGQLEYGFTVTNDSERTTPPFVVRVSVTGGGSGAVTLVDLGMAPLQAGATRTATSETTLAAGLEPGTYQLKLQLDPDGDLSLTDRSEASVEQDLVITAPVTSCADPDEVVSFEDPAIEAFVLARLASIGDGSMTCANVAQIQQLNVSNKGVTSLEGVQHLTGVYSASLYENQITDLGPLAGMTALESLSLFSNEITSLAPLADLPAIKSLSVYDNHIKSVGPLANLSTLESLTMENNEVADISPLAGLPNLRYLRAYRNVISSAAPLAQMTAIEHIDIRDNAFASLPDLSPLTSLTYLRVGGDGFEDASGVAGLAAVIELAIVDSAVTSIDYLSDLGSVEKLILAGNLIEDIRPLEHMTWVKKLNLDENRITAIPAIATMTGLDDVSIQGNKFTDLAPLAANLGLASGDWVYIKGNCFAVNENSVLVPPQTDHMFDLQSRGVNVNWTPSGSDEWCGRG